MKSREYSEEFIEKINHFLYLAESNEKYMKVRKEEEYDENDPFYKLLEEGNIAAIDLLLAVINSKEFHDEVNAAQC